MLGMARVLGEALLTSKNRDLDMERQNYAETMSGWMDEMAETEPWETAYWADFLADFPGTSTVTSHAKSVAAGMKSDSKVKQAKAADEDIARFTKKHFNQFIDVNAGKKPDPAREAEAEKLAAKYPGLPHAELLVKLGKPS